MIYIDPNSGIAYGIDPLRRIANYIDESLEHDRYLISCKVSGHSVLKIAAITAAGAATGGLAYVYAPAIGAFASGLGLGVGGGTLSGAAASSAGLAALGGGSLASGGLGMAGGTAVVTGVGGAAGAGVGAAAVSLASKD